MTGIWVAAPEPIHGCPPGLEYLAIMDQLLIHQQIDLPEAFAGWETSSKYTIKGNTGKHIYFVAEDSSCCCRVFCGPHRSFEVHIIDFTNREVMRIVRPYKCYCCSNCSPMMLCCRTEAEVQAPVGNTIGHLRRDCSCFRPKFSVSDAQDEVRLFIEGPLCVCDSSCIPCDQEFKIYTVNGKIQVGKITRQYSGSVTEMFAVTDSFIDKSLDVIMKAVLIGAVFLIDFLYFEKKADRSEDHVSAFKV